MRRLVPALSLAFAMAACGPEPLAPTQGRDLGVSLQAAGLDTQTVHLSVKVVLDADGNRPATGHFNSDAEITAAIDEANATLAGSGAGWRLALDEIVDLAGQSVWYEVDDCAALDVLEDDALANPVDYAWRFDAINLFVINTEDCGGRCSFPDGQDHSEEAILINNALGILNGGDGWLHEVAHYFDVLHTFSSLGECDPFAFGLECSGAGGGGWIGPWTCCDDICPDDDNIMSYNRIEDGNGVLSPCQLGIIDDAMAAYRPHVVWDIPSIVRGDANQDGTVDISDAIAIGNHLYQGHVLDCLEAADFNDDGRIDAADQDEVLDYLFLGTAEPAAPGADTCGEVPMDNVYLGCADPVCR